MTDSQFKQLLEHLDLSWEGYLRVRKGVKKRVARHMQAHHCRNMTEYITCLEEDPDLREACNRLVTVSISRFLRDASLWGAMEDTILPALVNQSAVRTWSAGCACGEEAYSLNIIRKRVEEKLGTFADFKTLATDINPAYLQKAEAGIYPQSSLRELPESWRDGYFNRQKRRYCIKRALKRDIVWAVHPFESGPPGSRFDLIFLRNNLLTYYRNPKRKQILNGIIDALNPNGWLIFGAKERLPSGCPALDPSGFSSYIFRKTAPKPKSESPALLLVEP